MSDPIVILPYDKKWKTEFIKIGAKIREALGNLAILIYHIGSTSIQGLDAKPIIDIQVSVQKLDPVDPYKKHLETIGFNYRLHNPDKTKRYFRECPGMRRTHIHVREYGSWSEQFSLLFRDYLRCHPDDCKKYVKVKYKLAALYRNERDKYVEGKEEIIWEIMRKASKWSQEIGWKVGKTDM